MSMALTQHENKHRNGLIIDWKHMDRKSHIASLSITLYSIGTTCTRPWLATSMYVSSQGTLMSSVSTCHGLWTTDPAKKMDKQVHMSHVSSWKMFILILHRIYCMIKFGNPGLKDNFSYLHTVTQSWYVYNVKKMMIMKPSKTNQITYPLHILSCQTVKQNTCVTWPVEVSRNNENWNDNNNIKKSKQ